MNAASPQVVAKVAADEGSGASPRLVPSLDAPPRRRRLRPRYLVIGFIALLALGFGANEVHLRLTHVYEYDARITADLVTVSSRVDGWLTELLVDEGSTVAAGDVIARIDHRIAEYRLQALQAQLAGIDSERQRLTAQRRMVDAQTSTRVGSRESAYRAAQASLTVLEADIALARTELERMQALYDRRITSKSQLDRAVALVRRLEGERQKIVAEGEEARGIMAEARADRVGVSVIDFELASLEHQRARLEAEIAQQRIDMDDRAIKSPIDGIVDRRFVEAGEYVGAGQRLVMMHDPRAVWVEANIKETSVRKLRIGQPVDVSIDAYPDRIFPGKVARIGSSTTSNFALLPTPNPSGNFTKITQRVPVRVNLEPADVPLSPGMMVEVNIDVRGDGG